MRKGSLNYAFLIISRIVDAEDFVSKVNSGNIVDLEVKQAALILLE